MDEKKVREAIERVKNFPGWNRDDLWLGMEDMEELTETILEALEKQLPKEIKAINPERSEESGDVELCCPNCNSHYLYDITDVPNYCPECGIKFDT